MLKKTITSKNLDGVEVSEDFYFNLTKAELIKLQLQMPDGMEKYMQDIIASGDGARLVELFETMIKTSFGRRTADGKFIKKPEYFDELVSSEAYSVMFMELVTDSEKGAEFVQGIMPADLVAHAMAAMKGQAAPTLASIDEASLLSEEPITDTQGLMPEDVAPALQEPQKPKHPKDMTKQELLTAMKLKNAKGRVLTERDLIAMDDTTIQAMIAAGATVEGL